MNKVILTLSLLSMTCVSCGPKVPSTRKHLIEPEIEPFVELFEQETLNRVEDINIVFDTLELPTLAMCTISTFQDGHSEKLIQVDPTYWFDESTTDEEKMGTIYHELGHCLLNRPHLERMFTYDIDSHRAVSVPSSLMYPYSFYSKFHESLRTYYVDELIHPERGL